MSDSFKNGSITEQNISAGTKYEYIGFKNFDKISIHPITLTNITAPTVEGILSDTSNGTEWIDVTNFLFGSSTLSQGTFYSLVAAAQSVVFKDLRIVYSRSDAVNNIDINWAIAKSRS